MHFTVSTAANGIDALALCVSERPHVLVADLRMPQMSGYQLLEALRANELTCDPQKLTLAVVSVLLRRAVATPWRASAQYRCRCVPRPTASGGVCGTDTSW